MGMILSIMREDMEVVEEYKYPEFTWSKDLTGDVTVKSSTRRE